MRVEIGTATLYRGDCMEILPTLPKADALVTDLPYGLNKKLRGGSWGVTMNDQEILKWDIAVNNASIETLLKSSKNHIIWGGNYYQLPPCRGLLSWYKPDAPPSMGHFEIAWTSIDRTAQQLSVSIRSVNPERVGHPTQKPVRLMEWCLSFLPQSISILDPFMGSGTTGVACANLERKFIGIEKDPRYFDIACSRIEAAHAQQRLPLCMKGDAL